MSPIDDVKIANYLQDKLLKFHATLDPQDAYGSANFVIIATPADYDPETNCFNTSVVCNPPIKVNILEVEFSVVYGSIYKRRLYEEIKIYG